MSRIGALIAVGITLGHPLTHEEMKEYYNESKSRLDEARAPDVEPITNLADLPRHNGEENR